MTLAVLSSLTEMAMNLRNVATICEPVGQRNDYWGALRLERRTVNRDSRASSPPCYCFETWAISFTRFSLCLSEEALKAPCVYDRGICQVTDPTQGVNV